MKQTWGKSPFLGRLRLEKSTSGNPEYTSMCTSGVVVVVLLFKWYCLEGKDEGLVSLVACLNATYPSKTDTCHFLRPHTVKEIYTLQLPSTTPAFYYYAISRSSTEMKGALKSNSSTSHKHFWFCLLTTV